MRDRICIRLECEYVSGHKETTPVFYGYGCGIFALKTMNEALRRDSFDINRTMILFLCKMIEKDCCLESLNILNDTKEARGMADYDWYCWTYNTKTGRWTTTCEEYEGREYTMEEIDEIVDRELQV